MLFEWIAADDKIKETVLAISDLLEKKNISISEFNTIKKLLTWVVCENTTCCKNKDSITDKGCDENHMDNKNTTENAVEFIWQAKITKDFYHSSSLKEIYDWLLNIAKSECDAKGTRIVNNKINVSFEFLLQSEFVLITVKQSVCLDL